MKVKIKSHKLPKDGRMTLRINKELKKALQSKKISIQAILDEALNRVAEVHLDIKIKHQ